MGVESIAGCNLDSGGEWGPTQPPGPPCPTCFGAVRAARGGPDRRPKLRNAALASGALAAAFAAVVLASPDMNLIPAYYGSGESALASPSASVTPGSSVVTPVPTEAPALTPSPTQGNNSEPVMSQQPGIVLPTFGPLPTYPPVPTWPPFPVIPQPPAPVPTILPVVCRHPGQHVGVLDLCKWPGNR